MADLLREYMLVNDFDIRQIDSVAAVPKVRVLTGGERKRLFANPNLYLSVD